MVSTLKQALIAEVEEDIRRVRHEAAEEACSILAEARQEANALRQEVLETYKREAEREANRLVREARQAAAMRQAQAYDRLTERLLDRLRDAIREHKQSNQDDYQRQINALLEEAMAAARTALGDDEALHIQVSEEDAHLLDEPPDDHLDGLGGVVVTSTDGAVRFDNSFESRIEMARSELRQMLLNAEL